MAICSLFLAMQVALPHLLLEEVQSSQLRRYTVCRAARAIRLLRRKVRGDRHGACHGTRPGRPKRLNPLQLRTLTLLQALPQERAFANPPEPDGTVSIHTLPHAHGDHFHIGPAVLSVRDAIGLDAPNVLNALARKGLLLATRSGLPVLTAEGLAYDTGIAPEILHGDDH
jgi:hypothetical protein